LETAAISGAGRFKSFVILMAYGGCVAGALIDEGAQNQVAKFLDRDRFILVLIILFG
jgi:hypothetical protein